MKTLNCVFEILKKFMHFEKKQEYEKDSVSELFQSSLLANKTDLVLLIMRTIESMSVFVLDNLPNVFRLVSNIILYFAYLIDAQF